MQISRIQLNILIQSPVTLKWTGSIEGNFEQICFEPQEWFNENAEGIKRLLDE